MGLFANTVSICHFSLAGDIPATDLNTWIAESLQRHSFRSIDTSLDEQSSGWVELNDPDCGDFSTLSAFMYDDYAAFSFRHDQRKIPATLFKSYLKKATDEYMIAHPGLRKVSKQKREDLKDAVRLSLLAKTLPTPSTVDLLWDTRTGAVTVFTLRSKSLELIDTLFKRTFTGIRLIPVHPISRAASLLDSSLVELLHKSNQARSDALLDQIRSNTWISQDFFIWLLHTTMNESSDFTINQTGALDKGTPFTGYLNDRFVLTSAGETGNQKVTVTGAEDTFAEVLAALKTGKNITEAGVMLIKSESEWKLTFKGELFHFASFKSPPVKIEKGAHVDQRAEQEAVFFERVLLLNEGLQMFDSLLSQYLSVRLSEQWNEFVKVRDSWL